MANSIALAQNYLKAMDEVYKASARTAILDSTNIRFINANTIQIYKLTMSGLADYSRNNGYHAGDVTGTWETLTLTRDRGTSFQVDAMDNEESIDMAFGQLAGTFLRTKVVPEIDAYTFAKIAGTSGIDKAAAADVEIGTTDIPGMIEAAEYSMNENEVPVEGRILFISEKAYAGLRSKVQRQVMNDVTGINTEVEMFNGMRIIRVPQNRFYTAVTLSSTDGYTKAGGAKDINFMIIHPSAVAKVVKHAMPRIFTPTENQAADAWKYDYRIYHDTFVYDNKQKGIYLSASAT